MINTDEKTLERLKARSRENNFPEALRISICSSGCCDPVLSLAFDRIKESDLVEKMDELTLVIDPDAYKLTGDIDITLAEDQDREGFMLTPQRPLSEWDGFTIAYLEDGAGSTGCGLKTN